MSAFQFLNLFQILAMTDSELKIVADHMGHNISIHNDIFRLQSSLLEKTKVAKVLIALENGTISKHNGKSLNSIHTDGKSYK